MKRNHVILNGRRSETVEGLLIQELPPVHKPLMRTEIMEIDGRDGSIVTHLGYESYEREMLIGLYGDFNIDEIIRFFNSSGTAIFSNEPDKVYRYQILEAIDFERLASFRVATVVFYVQPFKYSAIETAQEFTSGTSCEIINSGNTYAKPTITIYGTGTVTLSLNGEAVLVLSMSSVGYITIDAEAMNAYKGNTFLNRRVAGDYNDLRLLIGSNTLSWDGNVTKVIVENYSRWI